MGFWPPRHTSNTLESMRRAAIASTYTFHRIKKRKRLPVRMESPPRHGDKKTNPSPASC